MVNGTFQTKAPGSLVLNRVSRPRTPFPKLCSTEIVGVLIEPRPWRPLVLMLSYANSIKGASKLAFFVSYTSAVLYAEEDLASAAVYVEDVRRKGARTDEKHFCLRRLSSITDLK